MGLGGLNTRVTVFMTDGVIRANMTANDAIETDAWNNLPGPLRAADSGALPILKIPGSSCRSISEKQDIGLAGYQPVPVVLQLLICFARKRKPS